MSSDWEELDSHDFMLEAIPDLHTFRRRASGGTLTVIAGTEPEGFHLSISHPNRYPTWDEICEARDHFTPTDKTFVQELPPRDRWVNLHSNCFHLWEQIPCEHNGGTK